MDTLLLPTHTWDTINRIVFNRKVMMVGVCDGQDVVSIAQSALITVVYPSSASSDRGIETGRIAMLDDLLVSAALHHRVILNQLSAASCMADYYPLQFDAVIYNPGACHDAEPGPVIAQLLRQAATLIVIEPAGANLWDVVTEAVAGSDRLVTADGSILVGAPMGERTHGRVI